MIHHPPWALESTLIEMLFSRGRERARELRQGTASQAGWSKQTSNLFFRLTCGRNSVQFGQFRRVYAEPSKFGVVTVEAIMHRYTCIKYEIWTCTGRYPRWPVTQTRVRWQSIDSSGECWCVRIQSFDHSLWGNCLSTARYFASQKKQRMDDRRS
jgi:hypothetical protein